MMNKSQILALSGGVTRFHVISVEFEKRIPAKMFQKFPRLPIELFLKAGQLFVPYKRRLLPAQIDLSIHRFINLKAVRHRIRKLTRSVLRNIMLKPATFLSTTVQVIDLPGTVCITKTHSV